MAYIPDPTEYDHSIMAYSAWTLDAWKDMFRDIYGDKNVGYRPDQILHRLIEEVAELVKPVITIENERIKNSLPDVLAWICGFAVKNEIDMAIMMTEKYIGQGPGKGQTPLEPYSIIQKDKPETLDDWQKYLNHLYKDENTNNPPDLMLTRLVEDLGITSRNLRKHAETQVIQDKLAGVLAWTMGISNKFSLSLDQITWAKYPNMCFRCRKSPCRCSALNSLFLSYANDTQESMQKLGSMIKNDLGLVLNVFTSHEAAFRKMRMVEMFNLINQSDGGIVILDLNFSSRVYAEVIEMLRVMDEENVFVFAKTRREEDRERQLSIWLSDIKQFHKVENYEHDGELLKQARESVSQRIEQIKRGS